MRVTNQMVSANTMLYLNNTQKNMLDIQQQLTTGKKIGKPSDDPITAVRALKLKTDVSEIKQYKRNVSDATSWLDVTEQALTNMTDMYKRIRELTVQGSTGTYTHEDQVKMLEEIKQLKEQLGREGNVTYAGRYIFSGYKTNTPLVYTEDTERHVRLEESFTSKDLETKNMAFEGDDHPVSEEIYRVRLAYDNLDDKKGVPPTDPTTHEVTFSGLPAGLSLTTTVINSSDPNAYNPPKDEVYLVQDTGELIFHKEDAQLLKETPGFSINIEYDKTSFESDDQMPDHYYKGVAYQEENLTLSGKEAKLKYIPIIKDSVDLSGVSPAIATIVYMPDDVSSLPATIGSNTAYINRDTGEIHFGDTVSGAVNISYKSEIDGTKDQKIEYEVSIGQNIHVNTLGKNVLTTDAVRDLEELITNIEYCIKNVNNYDDQIKDINNDSSLSEDEKKTQIEAIEDKKRVYTSQINKYYDQMTTNVDDSIKQLANETASVGSKSNRLELTGNRLEDDKINFTGLLSKAEDIDLTETMIRLQSNEVVYNSSLMATSKIVQQSLVDFLR